MSAPSSRDCSVWKVIRIGKRCLRLGTRGSRLALAQASTIQALLQQGLQGVTVEIVPIRTSGDRGLREPVGAFVKEIQESLLSREIDIAQHCLKDLPTDGVVGLTLASFLPRADWRDALLSPYEGLEGLPLGSTVGTGSCRRSAQLAALRPDLKFKALVGNVDTRLGKLLAGEYDAIVLAMAGLIRLDLLSSWNSTEYAMLRVAPLEPAVMLPAPGQAVLVLEARSGDSALLGLLSEFDDQATRACAVAERTFLSAFGSGCSVPVGALARTHSGSIQLWGRVCSRDGSKSFEGRLTGADPGALGRELAAELGAKGAFDVVAQAAEGALL